MGPTIGEDYMSGVLWGKKLPGSSTFMLNCYYRCRDMMLAMRGARAGNSDSGWFTDR